MYFTLLKVGKIFHRGLMMRMMVMMTMITTMMMTMKVTRIVVNIEIGRNLYDIPGA